MKRRVIIMGAAGRDFHNFNVYFRDNEDYEVVAFTATQIPDIAGRTYPAELAGKLYPPGHSDSCRESELLRSSRRRRPTSSSSATATSRTSTSWSARRIVNAAGADFMLLGPASTMVKSKKPVVSITAVRTGSGKSQTTRRVCEILKAKGKKLAVIRHPMPYGEPCRAGSPALRDLRRPRQAQVHDRGTRGVRAPHRQWDDRLRRRRLREDPPRRREGGRRHHLGRRQQRLLVLQARPLDRRRRPASRRTRAPVLPERRQRPHGRHHRHQQGRHGLARRHPLRPRERPRR